MTDQVVTKIMDGGADLLRRSLDGLEQLAPRPAVPEPAPPMPAAAVATVSTPAPTPLPATQNATEGSKGE